MASPPVISRASRTAFSVGAAGIRCREVKCNCVWRAPLGLASRLHLLGGGIRQASGSSRIQDDSQAGRLAVMSNFSIEITEQGSKEIDNFSEILPPGTAVFIASLQNTNVADVVALCKRLKAEGMVPVPHIAARGIASEVELDKILSQFSCAGVKRVLLISGDFPKQVGIFSSAIEVCKTGLFTKHDIQQVDIAGHPEGNAKISNATHAILEKTEWAKAAGVRMDIMTQVCFDAGVVCEWVRKLREAGIVNRVNVGVAGPAKLSTLVKFAGMLGVGPSAAMLMSQPGLVAQIASMNDPAHFVSALSVNITSAPSMHGDMGVHMYSFGGFKRTAEWASQRTI